MTTYAFHAGGIVGDPGGDSDEVVLGVCHGLTVDGERNECRRMRVALLGDEIDARPANQWIVTARPRRVVRFVLELDLFELPVTAVRRGWRHEVALPELTGVAAAEAYARVARRAVKHACHHRHARLVILRLDVDRVSFTCFHRRLLEA